MISRIFHAIGPCMPINPPYPIGVLSTGDRWLEQIKVNNPNNIGNTDGTLLTEIPRPGRVVGRETWRVMHSTVLAV